MTRFSPNPIRLVIRGALFQAVAQCAARGIVGDIVSGGSRMDETLVDVSPDQMVAVVRWFSEEDSDLLFFSVGQRGASSINTPTQ